MEIRRELLKMLSPNEIEKVFRSYTTATYEPHKNDKCIQCGWNLKESATQLIFLLIIINSLIGTYLINTITGLSIRWLTFVFAVFMIVQSLFFIYRFKSDFSSKRRNEREEKLREYFQQDEQIHTPRQNVNNTTQIEEGRYAIFIAIISIGIGYFGSLLANYSFLFWQKYNFWLGFIIVFILFIGAILLLTYFVRYPPRWIRN